MKLSLHLLVLGVIAAPPRLVQAGEDLAALSIGRVAGTSAGHLMPANAIAHATDALTVDGAIKAIDNAGDNLGKVFDRPEFQKLIENKQDAINLYDRFYGKDRLLHYLRTKAGRFTDDQIFQKLQAFAFNRVPDKITSVEQIMAFKNERHVAVDFLVKSPAFSSFTENLPKLYSLIKAMQKDQSDGLKVWDKYLPSLKNKLTNSWIEKAIITDDIAQDAQFLHFLSDEANAHAMFLKLRFEEERATPHLQSLVERYAFRQFEKTYDIDKLIVKAYLNLKNVGLGGKFEYSEGYLAFTRPGIDARLALLKEMEKQHIPKDDEVYKSIETKTIHDALRQEAVYKKSPHPFIQELITTKEGLQKLDMVTSPNINDKILADYIKVENPAFWKVFLDAKARYNL